MKLKHVAYISIVLIVGAIVYISIGQKKSKLIDLEEFSRDFEKEDMYTYNLTANDSSLIAPDYRSIISDIQVSNSKFRHPVISMAIDKQYILVIYQFQSTVKSLDDIQVDSLATDQSTGYSYRLLDKPFFQYKYRTAKTDSYEKLFVSVKGDSLETQKDKDFLFYRLVCENFSVKYYKKGPVEIVLRGKSRPLKRPFKVPLNILFLKKNESIYLFTLTGVKPENRVPDNILLKVVNLKNEFQY